MIKNTTGQLDPLLGYPHEKIAISDLSNYINNPLEAYDFIGETPATQLMLASLSQGNTLPARSQYYIKQTHSYEWRPCLVLHQDQQTSMFTIRFEHNGQEKQVTRLNLVFQEEDPSENRRRIKEAKQHRYNNLYLRSQTQGENANNLQADTQIVNRKIFDNIFKFTLNFQ